MAATCIAAHQHISQRLSGGAVRCCSSSKHPQQGKPRASMEVRHPCSPGAQVEFTLQLRSEPHVVSAAPSDPTTHSPVHAMPAAVPLKLAGKLAFAPAGTVRQRMVPAEEQQVAVGSARAWTAHGASDAAAAPSLTLLTRRRCVPCTGCVAGGCGGARKALDAASWTGGTTIEPGTAARPRGIVCRRGCA